MKTLLFAAAFVCAAAFAQQPPGKTTEQQARSYIVSAFMTGAAPMVLAEDATITPDARQRLGVGATADSRAVYHAIVAMSRGTPPTARAPTAEETGKSGAKEQPGKPLFAVDTGDTTLVVQYDLERDAVSFVGQPGGPVAVASPVAPQPEPEKVPEAPPVVAAPPPAPAPVPQAAVESPKPQVVEPREPRVAAKPAAAPVPPPPTQAARAAPDTRMPRLRVSGPCVIKPVMSDQDLVNCGATPRY